MERKPSAVITSARPFLDKYLIAALSKAGYDVTSAEEDIQPDLHIIVTDGDMPDYKPTKATVVITTGMPDRVDDNITILRIPYVIGTGMDGLMINIATKIDRGTWFHIKGNEAKVSVIHALDVARIAVELAGKGGNYIISDGTDPTWHDLTEAISVRVGHKRIPTVKPAVARWLARLGGIWGGMTSDELSTVTADHTVTTDQLPEGVTPPVIEVTHYLSTHVYDENDL
ncbi:MAG: hypothetical protein NC098_04515 [Lachnoclostridium sp.]|nr:hypothetical protein [Lachnoclostridium sp.]